LGGLINEVSKRKEIKRLQDKLDRAEAFNFAYVGSRTAKGSNDFGRWQRNIVAEISKLKGQKMQTIWDQIGGKSRKM
jgi:hypothetical protein